MPAPNTATVEPCIIAERLAAARERALVRESLCIYHRHRYAPTVAEWWLINLNPSPEDMLRKARQSAPRATARNALAHIANHFVAKRTIR